MFDWPCDRCGKVHPQYFVHGSGRVDTCPPDAAEQKPRYIMGIDWAAARRARDEAKPITDEYIARLSAIESQRDGLIEREIQRVLELGVPLASLSTRTYQQELGRLDLVQGDRVIFSTWLPLNLGDEGARYIRYQRITWRSRVARRLAEALAWVSRAVGQ